MAGKKAAAATREDRWGYPLRTSSDACVCAIESFYDQVLSYGRSRAIILEAPRHDPTCILGNVLAAHFLASADPPRASSLLSAAAAALESGTSYEKAVYEAVVPLVGDCRDEEMALSRHLELLKEYPKDLVSLKRAQVICFYMGLPHLSLRIVEQALPANQGCSYVYGMLAFPLLELGRMVEAERAARRGLEVNGSDIWSQHCYNCHFKEAVEFMEACSSTWNSCSSFMYTHNWWHVAVCYLEGNAPVDKALEIYDKKIWGELQRSDSDQAEVYLNALGLLLRLDARGKIGDHKHRVLSAAEKLKDKLAEATYEYGKGNYQKVMEILGLEFDAIDFKMIGASDEQLDVFNEIFFRVLLNTGNASKAIDHIQRHIKKREGSPHLWRLLEEAYEMDGKGDAGAAAEKAKALEMTYFN
ncbi:hypothetical protein AXF42_Ash000098 [Apostasia shenzhenica]|uniref:Tetratricopeptide repeat protein 38 n=1 Tax=Apostasia shenzhenica TaxID=1088818 RepID=A0A2I0AFG9_9ASPA|nr:hypothetical protein AXF42_Ash000098 [Apostasia shenzhenica]